MIDDPSSLTNECPLDKESLGNHTWNFLHTMAAYFPETPTPEEERDMFNFLVLFSRFYPCYTCANNFYKQLNKTPPVTSSARELSLWMCRMHNVVNRRLGKSIFNCSLVSERWKDGWKDGSCD